MRTNLDHETNTHYNYFRDYDPALGRYAQSDPKGLKAGLSTYAYVKGQPLSAIDPLGLEVKYTGSVIGGGAIDVVGGQVFQFDFTSECKCNKIVHIKGFASFLAVGAGLSARGLPKDSSGTGGKMEMRTIWDCPDAADGNGAASVFGINAVIGAGASFLTRWRIGKLSSGFHLVDGPIYGLDVSASFGGGISTVTSSTTTECCSGGGK